MEEYTFTFDQEAFAIARDNAKIDELTCLRDEDEDISISELESSTLSNLDLYPEYDRDVQNIDASISETSNIDIDSEQTSQRCIVVDIIDGKISPCSNTQNILNLSNLYGAWEIDRSQFTSSGSDIDISTLGVCRPHYNIDQNKCHPSTSKQKVKASQGMVRLRCCLFCHRNVAFYTRGSSCQEHLRKIYDRNVQLPCIAFRKCCALTLHPPAFCLPATEESTLIRYVCTKCFANNGGHLFESKGPGIKVQQCTMEGNHKEDSTIALKEIAEWISMIAVSENTDAKNNLLSILLTTLNSSRKEDATATVAVADSIPSISISLFLTRTIMHLRKMKNTQIHREARKLDSQTCIAFGESLGLSLLSSHQDLKSRLADLENPSSLEIYWKALPETLLGFFTGLFTILERRKYLILEQKRRQRGSTSKPLDTQNLTKRVGFIVSIIVTIAFPGWKIWLTTIMASLCRKPKLLSSLQNILRIVGITSHSAQHEGCLEKQRLLVANPKKKLRTGKNIWNIAAIDNIDFMEKTFSYGNIFDATRSGSHATLRMIFQFELPISLDAAGKNAPKMSSKFLGKSDFTEELERNYHNIFSNLISSHEKFDIQEVNQAIRRLYPTGCLVEPPNVVILKPGPQPSCDENVFQACNQYFDDIGLVNNGYLDIVSDEAIFRRTIKYHEKHPNIRILLGQWHTNKSMCTTLIAAFSGYGIFDMAASLGVRFLDKLDAAVDYKATCQVLDLIWVAVGIAIHRYLQQHETRIDTILDGENNILKIWYLFFCWTGLWKAHKIGIRIGNFEMQLHSLCAFAPLFPVTGKSNYARSVAFYLSYLHEEPALRELLQYVASVNLTKKGQYFAFDEALETFGVKFIKQNIGGDLTDPQNLMIQIQGAQTERERIDKMVSEFVGDAIIYNREERTTSDRKDALWNLASQLTQAFNILDPKASILFKDAKEITANGIENILTCYKKGILRLEQILRQDIYKVEIRNTKGRRSKDIIRHTYSNILKHDQQDQVKEKKKINRKRKWEKVEQDLILTTGIHQKSWEVFDAVVIDNDNIDI